MHRVEVVLGADYVSDVAETTQLRIVSTNLIPHEDYKPLTIHNDICVVDLGNPIEFNG